MSRPAPFDPKAFLQARSQGRAAAPEPPSTPVSPQILGVDSDDDFSNLNSSFATLGSVGQASPGADDLPASPTTSPRPQRSPVNEPANVSLPPGHTGHQTPEEVVQNQLFSGYAVPQRLPAAVGGRRARAPPPPPSLQQPRPAPPPLARTLPPPVPTSAAVGPARPRPGRPPAFSRPRAGPPAARPIPNPTGREMPLPDPSAGAGTPDAAWAPPHRGRSPPPRAVLRPPTRPVPAAGRMGAPPPARPNPPPIRARPPSETQAGGPARPAAVPRQPLPPDASRRMGLRPAGQPFVQQQQQQQQQRASMPGRAPPPVRTYRSELMRRPEPAPFRPRTGPVPSRLPMAVAGEPVRPELVFNVVQPPQESRPSQSETGPDESGGYRSPSPLLLPAQSLSHGVPSAQRRIPADPAASKPTLALFNQGRRESDNVPAVAEQSSPRQPSRSRSPSPADLITPVQPAISLERDDHVEYAPMQDSPDRIGLDPVETAPSSSRRASPTRDYATERVRSPGTRPAASASRSPHPGAAQETEPNRQDPRTRSRFRDAESTERATSCERSTDSHPAWFDRGLRRLSPFSSVTRSITDERRKFFIQKAKLLSQRHVEEIDALKQQIQKLKASQTVVPTQVAVISESSIAFDDCLPYAFGENSRLVRRALEEQLDNNARMDAMLSKVTFILESGSYPESLHDRIGKASEARESKIAKERLASVEIRLQDLLKENEYLSKQLAAKEDRVKSVQEESRVLIDTLRQSLEQETFERKRMNALYDEERHVLNASLRETIQSLAADNERLRVRLVDAGLPDD